MDKETLTEEDYKRLLKDYGKKELNVKIYNLLKKFK